MSSFIEIKEVNKLFMHNKVPMMALYDINLTIEKGEFICFLGPSGCGKTTLLNMLGGYEQPSSGEIKIDGHIVGEPRRDYMTVFQGYDLLPWRTARKNIELGLETRKLRRVEKRAIADKYIEMVGLEEFVHHFPYEMSGGMRQRLSIARALAVEPSVLFMDEPFSALDLMTRLKIQNSILSLWRESGKTVILVTHIIEEAIYLANRIVIFTPQPGRIKAVLDIPPEAKGSHDSPEYKALKKEIYRVCEISQE